MARVPLSRLPDWNVLQEDQEIRGLRLQDEAGQTIGLIADLIVDDEAGYVDAVLLDTGEEVSTDDIEIGRGIVFLRRSSVPQQATPRTRVEHVEELRIPVVEERLRLGKHEVEGGGVRVLTAVEEIPVQERVPIREETIAVQRVPVHKPVGEGDIARAFQEGSFEVRAYGEELEVGKQLFVVEEIHINKSVAERHEAIHESVRRTRVDIQELPDLAHAVEPEQNISPLERRAGAQL
jgi:uncharacterized protein (TIGR02271 family)